MDGQRSRNESDAGVIILSFESRVRSSRDVVWASISSMDGVNAELLPILRMTHPRDVDLLDLVAGDQEAPVFCFRSWLLLGGVVPIDRHALTIEHLDPGVGFDEESTSWLQRRWRHERRIVDESDGGCLVTDRLMIEPRVPFVGPVVSFAVRRVFEHRHRRLRRRFGDPAGAEPVVVDN